MAFAGYKYGTARALLVHPSLLLLLPDPCSVLLRWLRSAGSRRQRRERLPEGNQTHSRRRNGSPPVARTRGPFRWCRGLGASGRRRGSRFHCTPTSRALKDQMLTATGGATAGADGSRRCGSSPWGPHQGLLPRVRASRHHSSSVLDPPSSLLRLHHLAGGAPGALAAARRLQYPRDRGRGRGRCPGQGLHDSGLERNRPGLQDKGSLHDPLGLRRCFGDALQGLRCERAPAGVLPGEGGQDPAAMRTGPANCSLGGS